MTFSYELKLLENNINYFYITNKISYHKLFQINFMVNKKDNLDPIDNLEYEKVLEEEIINSFENQFQSDFESDKHKNKFYRLKRTILEVSNRLFFFCFIGSFLFSFFLAFSENKVWFILYLISGFSCIFYTPNRKALKEFIAAWPNIEDLIKGRSLLRKRK